MTMKRFVWMIAITSAIVGVWETAQIGSSASIETQRPFTLKVATPQTTQASVRGNGYIPEKLHRSNKPSEGSRNVFGRDQRIPMTSSAYPWSAIGRLVAPIDERTASMCTGTLIARDLVVTNAHCVFGEDGKPYKTISFAPNLMNGTAGDEANVVNAVVGTNQPRKELSKDWAILKLDQPLGEKYGWMEWASTNVSTLTRSPKGFILAGYSGDFPTKKTGGSTAGVHLGCGIRGFESSLGLATHDCHMTQGASGGAIFTIDDKGMAVIVGLNSAQNHSQGEYPARFSRSTANYAVLTQSWAGAAQQLRDQAQR